MFTGGYLIRSLLGASRDYQRDVRTPVSYDVGFRYGEKKYTRDDEDCVIRPSLAPIKDPSYIELVRIALCYYIAKSDGVSEDEQAIIDEMCNKLLDDPDTNPDYRAELRMILADKGTNFANVRRYLNRVPKEELEQFRTDVMRIAEATDGISENERKAINIFQKYLSNIKNTEEDDADGAGTAKTRLVTMKCGSCGANLELSGDRDTAYCPYCGSNHLIERQ